VTRIGTGDENPPGEDPDQLDDRDDPEPIDELGAGSAVEPSDVLVIDDNELNRSTIVRMLRRAGLTVISTDTAIGATRLVLRHQVNVVVADLNMPAMPGSALLPVFRRNPRLEHVAVVLLSGVSARELVTAAREVGADAAIAKLEMAQKLVPTVTRLLKRAQRPKQVSGKYSFLPSILNTNKKEGT
jgi:CheY-like chemotaxis protein